MILSSLTITAQTFMVSPNVLRYRFNLKSTFSDEVLFQKVTLVFLPVSRSRGSTTRSSIFPHTFRPRSAKPAHHDSTSGISTARSMISRHHVSVACLPCGRRKDQTLRCAGKMNMERP